MNESGRSVAAALRDLRLGEPELLVVHDHIDLPFGRLRLTHAGGHGGHNGIRSLFELVGRDFDHVRMGVGRPASTEPDVVADYVLGRFSEPRAEVGDLLRRAADAVELWVSEGVETAMNEINATT
jgi:PTH1 family peptidyl-tRNA hydrolase